MSNRIGPVADVRWNARRLLGRRFRARPAASVLVAVLSLVTVLVAATGPRLVERQATAELAYQLTTIGQAARSLQGSSAFPEQWSGDPPPTDSQVYDGVREGFVEFRATLPKPLAGQVGAPEWLVQTSSITAASADGSLPMLGMRLTADPAYLSRVRIVSGTAPATWTGNEVAEPAADGSAPPPIDIALSTTAAAHLELVLGDRIVTGVVDGVPAATYRISGLFEPRDPADLYWSTNPSLVPVTTMLTQLGVEYPGVAAYVAPSSVGRLSQTFGNAQLSVAYPIRPIGIDGAGAALLRTQLASVITTGVRIPGGESAMPLVSQSEKAVQEAIDRGGLLAGLLALLAAAPLGVVIAVLVLGVQAVVRGRRPDLLLAAARGAAPWQLRGVLALEAALLAVPAAVVVTVVAAVAIPVRPQPADILLPLIAALISTALSAALAVTSDPPPAANRSRQQLRGIAEVAVILLAALSLFLLARRGLAQTATAVGIDPLLSIAPLLLSVSVGILVLRGYPLPMRLARRLATRGTGLPAFIGAIRATRAPTIGLAGVLALVVGLSVSLFSAVMLTTFDFGLQRAAQQTVGADARLDGTAFTPEQVRAVAGVRGVETVAGIHYLASQTLADIPGAATIGDTAQVLLTSTAQLGLLRSLPAGLTRLVDGRVPIVVSDDLLPELGSTRTATLSGVPVRIVGSLPAQSHLGPSADWTLVDTAFASRFGTDATPSVLLVGADPSRLPTLLTPLEHAVGADAAHPDITVTTVPEVVAQRHAEPVVLGVRVGLMVGAALSVLLCALALVLSTVAAASARGRTAGILRTLGMPRRRLSTLIAWELVPVGIVAVAGGAVLGIALPLLLTAAIDLRPFTGSADRSAPVFDAPVLLLVVAGFSLVVLLAGLIAVAVGDRVSPSSTLKMGES